MIASRMRSLGILTAALATGAVALSLSTDASAISRDAVMIRAKTIAYHPWRYTSANRYASCDSGYESVYYYFGIGDYMGLPYDWGGYKSVFQFDQDILNGEGAGSYESDGVLSCTTGVDCSGYVSQCWDIGYQVSTAAIPDITSPIDVNSMLAGDAINAAGYHVVLFSHETASGEGVFYQAIGWGVSAGILPYSALVPTMSGYSSSARRYDSITGADAGNPQGTPTNPIDAGTLPGSLYSHSGNTLTSPSDALDGCNASASTPEEGPEVVYQVTITQPGTLRATLSGDSGTVDNDVHLYESMNTTDCVARHNTEIIRSVDCGTYYVVVDTYGSGTTHSGPYTLQLELQNPSGTCGSSGPDPYDFEGQLGDSCHCQTDGTCYYCNETLGGAECQPLGNADSYVCTQQCSSSADCAAWPGSCCAEVTDQNNNIWHYCVGSDYCGGSGGTGGTGGTGTGGTGTGNSGTGGYATGGWGTGNDGTGADAAGLPGSPGDDDDSDEESGCSTVAASPSGSSRGGLGLMALLALGPVAAMRRARRGRRTRRGNRS